MFCLALSNEPQRAHAATAPTHLAKRKAVPLSLARRQGPIRSRSLSRCSDPFRGPRKSTELSARPPDSFGPRLPDRSGPKTAQTIAHKRELRPAEDKSAGHRCRPLHRLWPLRRFRFSAPPFRIAQPRRPRQLVGPSACKQRNGPAHRRIAGRETRPTNAPTPRARGSRTELSAAAPAAIMSVSPWLHGGCSSMVRVPDCGSGCCGFESHQPPFVGEN